MKRCCSSCFVDKGIIGYINEIDGRLGDCDYCNKTSVITVPFNCEFLIKYFSIFKEIYGENPVRHSKQLIYLVHEDWNLMDLGSEYSFNLFNDIAIEIGLKPEAYYTINPGFNEYVDVWYQYMNEIKNRNRFSINLSHEFRKIFDGLLYSRDLVTFSSNDFKLYRARIGGEADEWGRVLSSYEIKKMGMPPAELTTPGRANPKGIPYLYTADTISTAISEVKPYKGSKVSVAEITLKGITSFVDFSNTRKDSIIQFGGRDKDVNGYMKRQQLIKEIGWMLSKPVSPSEDYIEYIPTQYLTEYIKNSNYDGIKFTSSLEVGNNYVLFDQEKVKFLSSKLYQVNNIKLSFSDFFY